MHRQISAQKLATLIIIFAILLFVGAAGYSWYRNATETFIAGAPPEELINEIPAKSVPYDQIKPPAISPYDAFLIGGTSSTYGVVFYGDYTNAESNKIIQELVPQLQNFGGIVRLNWRYLPETTKDGDVGFEAAVASECSRLLNEPWPLHQLFTETIDGKLSKNLIKQLIQNASPEPELIFACQNNSTLRDNIRTAIQTAKSDGIDKAPFIFVGTTVIPADSASTANILNALQTYVGK